MTPEPLRGDTLRAVLRSIADAPIRDLPVVTAERLAAVRTRSQAGAMNGRKAVATRPKPVPAGERREQNWSAAIPPEKFRERFRAIGLHALAVELGQRTLTVARRAGRLGLIP